MTWAAYLVSMDRTASFYAQPSRMSAYPLYERRGKKRQFGGGRGIPLDKAAASALEVLKLAARASPFSFWIN